MKKKKATAMRRLSAWVLTFSICLSSSILPVYALDDAANSTGIVTQTEAIAAEPMEELIVSKVEEATVSSEPGSQVESAVPSEPENQEKFAGASELESQESSQIESVPETVVAVTETESESEDHQISLFAYGDLNETGNASGEFPSFGAGNQKSLAGIAGTHDMTCFFINVDGSWYSAYCVVPTDSFVPGSTYTSKSWSSSTTRNIVGDIIANGYNSVGSRSESNSYKQAVTQIYVWQALAGNISLDSNGEYVFASVVQTSINTLANNIISSRGNYTKVIEYAAELKAKLVGRKTIPSFSASSSSAATVINLPYNSSTGTWQTTITDSNGVLSRYDFSGTGLTVSRSGNRLTISKSSYSSSITSASATYSYAAGNSSSVIYWTSGSYQPVVTYESIGTSSTRAYIRVQTEVPTGDITIQKTAEDLFVDDITFRVRGTAINGTSVNLTASTNGSGKVVFKDVLMSNENGYTVTEVNTENRYVIPPSQNVKVGWNTVQSLSVVNTLKKFQVSLTKQDSGTSSGTAQGDATLEGAIYALYKNGVLQQRIAIRDGVAKSTVIECEDGTSAVWTLKEISAPTGYKLSEQEWVIPSDVNEYTAEVTLVPITATEDVIKGKIALEKVTDNSLVWDNGTAVTAPEADAQFQVYLKSSGSYVAAASYNRDLITTDAEGKATTKDLPYGTYVVHQIAGAEGYELIADFEVQITEDGEIYSYELNNMAISASLKVIKKDIETGEIIPVVGVGFSVCDLSTDTLVTVDGEDVFYTDENGEMTLPVDLRYGSYEAFEVYAPDGYSIDPAAKSFIIDGTEKEILISVSNLAQKGKIGVFKKGNVFVDVEVVDDMTQPVYEQTGLPGATYTVTAAEDIITPDGTLRAAEGTVVAELTTDEDGYAETGELYLGKYSITEVTAPEGYINDEPDKEVTLTYEGQEIIVQETTNSTFVNSRQKVQVLFEKYLEVDEHYGIGMGSEYQNVVFGIFAANDIMCEKGDAYIPADSLIDVTGIDENGMGAYTVELPFGDYYVKEIATDEHYYYDEDARYEFSFTYQGQDIAVVDFTLNDGAPIVNTIKRGDLELTKQDVSTGKLLPDTGVQIKDEDGNVVVDGRTDENGVIKFEQLPYGKYTYQEYEAPEGYLIDESEFPFEILEDGEIIKAVMTNEIIRGDLEITKQDISTGELLPDCGVQIKDEDGNVVVDGRTDENGVIKFEQLPYGKYTYQEFDAPKGYILDESEFPFEILEDGEIIKCIMTNTAKVGTVVFNTDEKPGSSSTTANTADHTTLPWCIMLFAGSLALYIFVSNVNYRKSEVQ